MVKIFKTIGAVAGSGVGWWIGAKVGIMSAVVLSAIGTGVGIYAGSRYAEHLEL